MFEKALVFNSSKERTVRMVNNGGEKEKGANNYNFFPALRNKV
jgi:hypothetical protein